jgi:hypothetical protein
MPNDRTRDDDPPSSERLRAGRANGPLFPDTLRPPAGDAVPPPPSTNFGSPRTPELEALDHGWDDEDQDDDEDEDEDEDDPRKSAEERASARKEKARKRAERRKSRSAAAAAKQKRKHKSKKQKHRGARAVSAGDPAEPHSDDAVATSSRAPVARRDQSVTVAIVIAVVVAIALVVAALLARTS